MKLHRSKLTFLFARFLTASFLLLRVPYWLAMAALCEHKRELAIQNTKTYLLGSFYCLADWKKLLMNREAVEETL